MAIKITGPMGKAFIELMKSQGVRFVDENGEDVASDQIGRESEGADETEA